MTAEKPAYYMTTGSEGHRNYLVLARIGNVLISFKPQPISRKENLNGMMSQHTVVAFTLRASYDDALLATLPVPEVVPLGLAKTYEKPGEALPGIDWMKSDKKRASTIIGTTINGSLNGGPENREALLKSIRDGVLAQGLVTFLSNALKGQQTFYTDDVLAGFITSAYGNLVTSLIVEMDAESKVFSEMQTHVGKVGVMSKMLAQAAAALKKNQHGITSLEIADAGDDDYTDPDAGGHDDYEDDEEDGDED